MADLRPSCHLLPSCHVHRARVSPSVKGSDACREPLNSQIRGKGGCRLKQPITGDGPLPPEATMAAAATNNASHRAAAAPQEPCLPPTLNWRRHLAGGSSLTLRHGRRTISGGVRRPATPTGRHYQDVEQRPVTAQHPHHPLLQLKPLLRRPRPTLFHGLH
ncbi:hypothetical protein Dimus_028539 [Dionaea muscipula]